MWRLKAESFPASYGLRNPTKTLAERANPFVSAVPPPPPTSPRPQPSCLPLASHVAKLFWPAVIAYNGSGSSSRMGVLDNCFTVGWAAEKREGRGEERERKVEEERRREKPEREREGGTEREQGTGSLEFVAHRIFKRLTRSILFGSSLAPPSQSHQNCHLWECFCSNILHKTLQELFRHRLNLKQ